MTADRAAAKACPDRPCNDGDACTYDEVETGTEVPGYCEDPACTNKGQCEESENKGGCDSTWHKAYCEYGVCAGTSYSCDDGNPCTDDSCDGSGGCAFSNNAAQCNDGDACTSGDVCGAGVCAGDSYSCDDGSTPIPGCGEQPECASNLECDDANVCNGSESCIDGTCIAGSPLDCDDGDECTTESCDPATGCVSTPIPGCGEQPECEERDTQSCTTGLPGICEAGSQLCGADGHWGDCKGNEQPGKETCDGVDNDCDSSIDEDLGTITCGAGVCQVTVDLCVGGQVCECEPGEPGEEICGDGLDNDCDGEVDEGCECAPGKTQSCYAGPTGTEGVGCCKAGTQTCDVNGQWGDCMDDVSPSDEVCDDLDNDCDGSVDEGLGTITCGVGECEVTVDACVGGEEQECVPGQPANEMCDGLDNDCDGKIDERRVCGEDEEEPTPPPPGPAPPPPAPTPTPIVEVLGVEMLPVTGEMPLAPALPTLPMILSSLTLIGSGLLLRGSDED